jgi:hypothetical protein
MMSVAGSRLSEIMRIFGGRLQVEKGQSNAAEGGVCGKVAVDGAICTLMVLKSKFLDS